MKNFLIIINPYKVKGTWVFDDERVDLVQEPFVFGMPVMIDELVVNISNAEDEFRLIFSKNKFPRYQKKMSWVREECDGNWYTSDDNKEGWVCLALLKYFELPPKKNYVRAEQI